MNTLIVVDMQNDFINIDGKLPVKGAFEALFNIYALIESNEIDKVIFTADWHVPSHESFKLNGGQWPEHCVQFSEGAAIFEGLLQRCSKVHKSYYVTTKAHEEEQYGAFQNLTYNPNCEQVYYYNGNDELCYIDYTAGRDKFIICGVAGDYCVLNTIKNLVISTDNQTEYQLGFWTIHGDVGDFDPIQGLWKTEVYELAKWLIGYYYGCGIKKEVGTDGARKICDMCEAIKKSMSLTPTDGLGISNSDLEQIGAKSYNEVDDILKTLISCESSEGTYMLAGNVVHIQANKKSDLYKKYGEDVVNKVWSRHLASEFKREKAPIYILREKYN